MKVKALKGYAYFEPGIVITLLALMMVVIYFKKAGGVEVSGKTESVAQNPTVP
jgi:hypothetical protein